jgi:16S rRNA (cytosine967-C5)-methyltransferase
VRAADGTSREQLLVGLATAGIDAEASPFGRDAIRLPPGTLGKLDTELRDRLRVQDEGAQLVAEAAGVTPGERVLDLCASPGGKSLILRDALRLGGETSGLLVSADYRRARVDLLARTLRQAGGANIVRLNARRALPFPPVFDCVLVDVPCSGLGTLRRDPDLKWSRVPGDLASLVEAEVAILREAATVVRPGGRLIYATCSSEPDENDWVVDTFLREDSSFVDGPLAASIPASLVNERGRLTTRPDRHGMDAFFAAVLVRR